MSDIKCDPYIFFQGNAREAMEFYQKIFGGELYVQTHGEAGIEMEGTPPNYVMHAALTGGKVILMASDTSQASPVAKKVSISLQGEDEEELREIFDKLSEDVEVIYPLKKESWGDIFGAVIDKYGVDWMVNISAKS